MKRNIKNFKKIVVVIIMIILLSAVVFIFINKIGGSSYIGTPVQTDFSVDIDLTCEDWHAKGNMIKSSEEYIITFNEPEEIEGMKFKYDGNTVSIHYMGLSTEISNDSLLLNSVSSTMIQCINHALSGKNTNVSEDGENYIVKGKSDNGDYELEVEKSSGTPLALKVNNIDFTCTFTKLKAVESSSSE